MLALRLVGLFFLAVAGHEEAALGGQKKASYLPGPSYLPAPYPTPSYPVDKFKRSTPYDVSEPIYTCPKPGYVLQGEDCVFVDTVPARFECPIGYTPEGGVPGRPDSCRRVTPATLTCPRGVLINGMCRIVEYQDASLVCPPGTDRATDGLCVRLEPIAPIERCPPHSSRINGDCVEIDYHEPVYVCPPDTVQDGRKCRREIVTFKEKHRKLTEEDTPAVVDEETEDEDHLLHGQTNVEDLFVDLPEHIFHSDNVPLGQTNELQGIKNDPQWMPAYYQEPLPRYSPIPYDPIPYESYPISKKEGKVKEVKLKEVKVKEPAVKIKEVKIKMPKQPAPPQQIIKVQYLPADKVCEIGERHGGACITQIVTPPLIECPAPLVDGTCARRVIMPPTATCPMGLDLVCPPRLPGHHCRCEIVSEAPPIPTCPFGVLDPIGHTCTATAPPKEYCPLGYFLDANGTTCTKRDVEAALCLFQVTYVCPDCDKYERYDRYEKYDKGHHH